MAQVYTKEYFTWKGIWDEMCALKKSYGDRGVPKDTWDLLEGMCKEAAADMRKASRDAAIRDFVQPNPLLDLPCA